MVEDEERVNEGVGVLGVELSDKEDGVEPELTLQMKSVESGHRTPSAVVRV